MTVDDPWVRAFERFEPTAREALGIGPGENPLDLVAVFEAQNQRAAEADARLASEQFTVTSENGLISVTMTGKGTIQRLDIDDDAYGRYRPRELGPAVLEVVNAAMLHCADLFKEIFGGVFGDDGTVDSIVANWPGRRSGDPQSLDAEEAGWT